MEKVLNERQAAELLGISSRHLFVLRKRGRFPHVKWASECLLSIGIAALDRAATPMGQSGTSSSPD